MRRTMIIALAVLTLSLILCATGASAVNRAVEGAEKLRQAAERAARLGNIDTARENAKKLYDHWEARGKVLELVTSHDALYEVRGDIADAMLCLENGDAAEFFRASAAVAAAMESLRVTESLRWANLY